MWSTTGLNIRTIALPYLLKCYCQCHRYITINLFADDTNLFAFHRDLNTLDKLVNHELELLNTNFKVNKHQQTFKLGQYSRSKNQNQYNL